MDRKSDGSSDVQDWKRVSLIFAKKFVSDIICCESFQTCDRELKQRINHLFFILKCVEKGNNQQHLLSLLLDYKTILEEIESGSISLTSASHFKAWQSRFLERYNEDDSEVEPFVLKNIDRDSNSAHSEETLETENTHLEELDECKKESDFVCIAITKRKVIKEETSQEKKRCHICNFETTVRKRYEKHLFEEHNLKSCHDCEINFDDFAQFYQHSKSHKKPDPKRRKWKCDHCEFSAKYERALQNHLFRMHDKTACSKCGENFTDAFAFDAHLLTHLDPFQCQYCPAVFYNKEHVQYHERNYCRVLKEPEMAMCQKCGKSLAKMSMKYHLKSVHGHGSVNPCPYCGKNVKGLAKHIRITQCNIPEDQRNIKTVQCPICFKMIQSNLKTHIRRTHGTHKSFKCEHCDYKTNVKGNLYIHVKRVHERKPLKETCPICNKQVLKLDRHLQTYHASVS